MSALSDYGTLDATALRASILDGARSERDAVEEALARIERFDGELGCFLSADREAALAHADELARERAGGHLPGPLHGVPVALKSNMCLEGREANCGSRILAGYRPPYTATFVQRLIDAGAVPIGMTNMDEFAMGSSGENSAFGPTRNPWDASRTPGGSSSGSSAAVAAGLVPIALGSDTGGSVRQPAALCGVSGFKPTYGRVSRYGLIAFGSSLDQVSPLARSTRDLERVMGVISGADERDSTCVPQDAMLPAEPGRDLAGLRIGIPDELFPKGVEEGVLERVRAAIAKLVDLGAETKPVRLPTVPHAIPTYYVVATAEASSNLARYEGVGYGLREEGDGSLQGMFAATRAAGFGDEVKRRILLGTYALSSGYYDAWYDRALRVRRLLRQDFDRAFEGVDLVLGPTSPTVAFALGERAEDPVAMYSSDVLTTPASLAGLPAVSTPCGFVDDLPVGLQLIGPPLQDALVLRVARAFEEATPELRRATPQALEGAAA